MDSLSAGMRALSKIVKGKEFLLLILIILFISIGGTTYGMYEEIISFYPIIIPIFINSDFERLLPMAPLYMGVICRTMFSKLNPTCVIIGSIAAGINFIDGIVLRIIGLVFGIIIYVLYLFFYYKRIQKDETKSITYDIKEDILKKYLVKNKEFKKENGGDNNKISEEKPLKENIDEDKKENKENKDEKFSLKQKLSIIIFFLGLISFIIGALLLKWTMIQMATVFFILAVIFMFMLNKGEEIAIESFMKGAGEFVGVSMVIGIARGINLTLEQEKISDTILNSLSNLVDGLPKVAFIMIMFVIYIILGFFIQSTSGLAVLSMPPFAPLADKVHCSRAVVVNVYMFGQFLIGLIAPTGLILIII